jgi:hypothetical protein
MAPRWAAAASVGLLALARPGRASDTAAGPFLNRTGLVPGTACAADAKTLWPTYFGQVFEDSLQQCTTAYAGDLLNGLTPISRCMQDVAPENQKSGVKLFKGTLGGFSAGCADCIGSMTNCVLSNCPANCFAGGSTSPSCRSCSIETCAKILYTCGGLDTSCAPNLDPAASCPAPVTSLTPIIIGAVAGTAVVIFLVLCIQITRHNRRIAAERELFAHQLSAAALNAPKLAHRAPTMAQGAMDMSSSLERQLVTVYAFLAENDSELSVMENERLVGVKVIDDDWWLARNGKGKVGLVPLGYVREEGGASQGPAGGEEKVEF